MFENVGFEYVGHTGLNNFTKAKWHLFKIE